MHFAKTAPRPFPAEPEHQGPQPIQPGRVWRRRHSAPRPFPAEPDHLGSGRTQPGRVCLRRHSASNLCCRDGEPPLAGGAPAPDHSTHLNHSPGFTIPPAWLRHAVPPLHKGGCGVPPLAYCAAALGNTAKQNDAIRFTIPPDMAAAPRRHKGGFSLPRCTQPAFSVALGTGGGPAWGAKKVGEKLSFSPRGPVAGQPYFLCPGKHNRQRQRKLWVQRHAGPAVLPPGRSLDNTRRSGCSGSTAGVLAQILYDNVIRLSLKWTFSTGTWIPSR